MRAAVRDVLLAHKSDGDPIVVWRDAHVVWVPADEIVIPPLDDEPRTTCSRLAVGARHVRASRVPPSAFALGAQVGFRHQWPYHLHSVGAWRNR